METDHKNDAEVTSIADIRRTGESLPCDFQSYPNGRARCSDSDVRYSVEVRGLDTHGFEKWLQTLFQMRSRTEIHVLASHPAWQLVNNRDSLKNRNRRVKPDSHNRISGHAWRSLLNYLCSKDQ